MPVVMMSPLGITISGNLIKHVRQLYDRALEYLSSGNVIRQGINGYSPDAPVAYIVAVVAVESFVNEALLSGFARSAYNDSVLWTMPKDSIERMELGMKLMLIPQLLFGKSFSRSSQPYQDVDLLIKVRNQFVHHKMEGKSPKYLKALDQRRVSLALPESTNGSNDHQWVERLSSSEGIRWAHNTVCDVIKSLYDFVPLEKTQVGPIALVNNFSPISDLHAKDWLKKRGIDPESSHPSL